ncbi:MAG: hypothetical protein AAGG51_16750 [Cyanobacteria bacterium P01_G01_bin.54]
MITIDFYICSELQIRACQGWETAADDLPCTGICIPNQSALTSLAGLLTNKSLYPALPLADVPHPIHRVNANVVNAINDISHDDLLDISVQWATLSPWSEIEINPFDLAGFLVHLKSLWHESDEPQKAIFLWFGEELI